MLIAAWWLVGRWTASDLELELQSDEPVAVRLALTEDQEGREPGLQALAQAIYYPEDNRVLLYFVNTDARYEADDDALAAMSPSGADQFSRYTDVSSQHYLHITRTNTVRLLNLLEGLTIFLDEPIEFKDEGFRYPNGLRFFPGEQLVEYMLGRTEIQPGREHLTGIDRVLRIESTLLNLFWDRGELAEILEDTNMALAAAGLFESDLTPEEIVSLFSVINADPELQMSVIEMPLEQAIANGTPVLVVKEQRARTVYIEYRDDVRTGVIDTDSFPVEVLNGTDVPRMAARMKSFLQDRALLVLNADNYRFKPLERSYIIERSGDTFRAQHFREMTGLAEKRVMFRRQPIDVDATLLIGRDFDTRQLSP